MILQNQKSRSHTVRYVHHHAKGSDFMEYMYAAYYFKLNTCVPYDTLHEYATTDLLSYIHAHIYIHDHTLILEYVTRARNDLRSAHRPQKNENCPHTVTVMVLVTVTVHLLKQAREMTKAKRITRNCTSVQHHSDGTRLVSLRPAPFGWY